MFWKRRKNPIAGKLSFKNRVTAFWDWYGDRAAEFYQAIEDGRCSDLVEEVSTKCEEFLPGFAWVFGPGANNIGHSFTLSAEGNLHRRLLTQFWVENAPVLDGWTFYPARQPSPDLDPLWGIEIGGRKFSLDEFWVSLSPDDDDQVVDLMAWHPGFAEVEEAIQQQVLYLSLDEALGEDAVEEELGRIDINQTRLVDPIPICDLRGELDAIWKRRDWKKCEPGEKYTLYKGVDLEGEFPRADVFSGVTTNMRLVNEYLRSKGAMDDPLERTGAVYAFVAFDSTYLKRGEEVDMRAQLEDAVDAALKLDKAGRCIGGALGTKRSYLDLLLFDPNAAVDLIGKALKGFELPGVVTLHPFAGDARKTLATFRGGNPS